MTECKHEKTHRVGHHDVCTTCLAFECTVCAGRSVSGQTMCELVSFWAKWKTGKYVDPQSIWNASPSGELYGVFDLFETASHELPPEMLAQWWAQKESRA
jgi:hypothetical protein